MKYEKAQNILPQYIVNLIQEYTDGGYLYIPRKNENKKSWGEISGTKSNLRKRNKEIFIDYEKGMKVKDIAKKYYLSESSIRKIIRQEKNI
ncbi:response regulator receiver protein [[Clostridium] sordellii]|uniref:M trans-acting positive regulator (MGA) HTHdomain protein n=1 Tax=Paraclostridium sordellii TaxID=1505 RepID=A0ABM9RKW5_PARSO|nr:CD3324 family protein [Paeniclostridium sordellii]EPZ55574.1 phage terminase small subunit [[Clostridium] sordellii ATCC 9714] [Paeniclostridium sordellii ATCC 9714]TAN65994.1 DNA-binding response regulator [Paeniclostridium sordellii 8483]CEJ72646.1 M trans-acting positive regulator (MGA) HTHdomain protein [[Clostridium] sordellii] [Paeniclostridium sordellii]CEK31024.1 response regulator receiver protein [[Clostridium] sordellii] [Paeniclostridium sordellii]CEN68199.1 response regulator r